MPIKIKYTENLRRKKILLDTIFSISTYSISSIKVFMIMMNTVLYQGINNPGKR